MAKASESQFELPVRFRGYDREATDAFFARLKERYTSLTRERDGLQQRVDELESEIEEHRERTKAVGDALVTAQQIAAELNAKMRVVTSGSRKVGSVASSTKFAMVTPPARS